ncbi:xanthine dehydrogenase family protein molybdopterin-binding subunit [Sphingomonas montanisoli]|uniref:Xanthine dehydrogenase family protein molybdopterin-binding subunit n=2 Tax=Sphingomonas montanisoli TaxID=2606412 RepID=A0A5D9CCE3_9SPHN|nr:xanthine dehydrogenase family protein molybdopterin-binding subunit [Sphingomonas montanisoli]
MHGQASEKMVTERKGITRRRLLIGGGVATGLVVGWTLWPRTYRSDLTAAPGETIFGAFLKIGADGRVVVAVPQAEMGQGVYTSLPQILADELGADWRTVGVEPAPVSPVYANSFIIEEAMAGRVPSFLGGVAHWAAREIAMRGNLILTGGSTSIRAFEAPLREAGAVARSLLCMVAAKRWGIDWAACDTKDGFVVRGEDRLRFADLAAEAAGMTPPDPVPLREPAERTIVGTSVPRLDLPSKVDGSARFGADVRLPGMLYASIAHGPYGGSKPAKYVLADAEATPGVAGVVIDPHFIAVIGINWWAADSGLQKLQVEFETAGPRPNNITIARALKAALDATLNGGGGAKRFVERGEIESALSGTNVVTATYSVPMLAHAPMETLTATARFTGDRLEVWVPTQAAGLCRAGVAKTMGMDEGLVTLYPTLVGGGFGRKVEIDAACEAAIIAKKAGKPVQLVYPRREDIHLSRFRPPALGRLRGRIGPGGTIAGWEATIAAPATQAEMMGRLRLTGDADAKPESGAIEGATPPYATPALAVSHAAAAIGVGTGVWRSVANSYTAFFNESFADELAQQAGLDPLSFRMATLSGAPRLAHCLTTATALGGWQGGQPGVGQGIAVHSCFGSHVAMMVEVEVTADQGVKVLSVSAAVDCGHVIHPDIVLQQIEGGIVFGLSNAFGSPVELNEGMVTAQSFDALGLPMLTDTPEIRVELIESAHPAGGVGEIAVPPVAPAIANAIFAATGKRLRNLPLRLADA